MVEGPEITALETMQWVGDTARLGAELHPQRIAIIMPEQNVSISYSELERLVGRATALLRDQGFKPGDRLAYLGKNHALFYILLLAAIRGKFIVAPLNWRCVSHEIHYFLEDSEPKLLFCDPEFSTVAEQAMEGLASPPALQSTTATPDERSTFITALEQDGPTDPSSAPHDDSVCLLLYTSGTSGKPKGALCTHKALSISRQTEFCFEHFPTWRDGTMVSAMPHFHIGGISWMLMGLMRQSTCVLTIDPSGPNIARLLREHNASTTFAVPTVVRSIVEEVKKTGAPIPSLDIVFYGAAPIGESLLRDCIDVLGCRFGQFYGMTEVTGSATFLPPASHDLERPELMQSVGLPFPGVALDVRDETGNSLPPDTAGELWIRTPTLMTEYWKKPELTVEVVEDGWYRSGDGGFINSDGYLFLTDRIKDIIVSGGENIYPAEVEEAVRQHPAVLDVAVVAKPDERWGESVMAVVENRPGETVDKDTLTAFVRTRLAGFKCPKTVVFLSALPRTASGKVQRGKAKEMALQQLSEPQCS